MGLMIGIGGRGGGGKSGGSGSLFWIKNLDSEAVTVSLVKSAAGAPTVTLEKSTGRDWSTWGSTSTTALTQEIPVGGVLILRGDNAAFGSSTTLYNKFSFTGNVGVYGNMAALTGEATVTSWEFCFANLFNGCTAIKKVDVDVQEYSCGMFYGCTGLTKISIPKTSTAIHVSTFEGCTGLAVAKIPNGVISIGQKAFRNCTNLATVIIPSTVTSVGQQAFDSCGLTSQTVPDSVTTIGQQAFNDCASMTSIEIGDHVTTIGQNAFNGCSGLAAVYYRGTVAKWCDIAFGSQSSNPLMLGHDLYIEGSKVTTLEIPRGVTEVKQYAFYGCSMTTMLMDDSVMSVGKGAFQSCTSLSAITLSSVLRELPDGMFDSCGSLTRVTIPDSVTSIGESAFGGCGLTDIELPSGLTYIGIAAFAGNKFTSVSVPSGVTRIAAGVFASCRLEDATILGTDVTAIGDESFASNVDLLRFTCYSVRPPDLGRTAFSGCDGLVHIYVPTDSVSLYQEAWSDYARIISEIATE